MNPFVAQWLPLLESNNGPVQVITMRAQFVTSGGHTTSEVASPGVPEHVGIVLDDPPRPLEDKGPLLQGPAIDLQPAIQWSEDRFELWLDLNLLNPILLVAPTAGREHCSVLVVQFDVENTGQEV